MNRPLRISRRRVATSLSALALTVVLLPTLSWAHAVVFPRQSAPGAYEKYVLRVPNEKAVATTKVELRFPAGVDSAHTAVASFITQSPC